MLSFCWVEYSFLWVLSFHHLKISCHLVLNLAEFLLKSQLIGVTGKLLFFPCCIYVFYLSLILDILIAVWLWYGSFWVDPVWDSLYILGLDICFLSQVRGSFQLLCLQICPLPLSHFSFWNPYKVNVSMIHTVPDVCNHLHF